MSQWCQLLDNVCTVCSLVADIVLFNSRFNLDSFLDNVESFLHMMPDCRPQGVRDKLVVKCHVLYFPVQFVDVPRLGRQFTGCTVTECGSGDGRQPSEVCSCNTDNLVHTVSIVSDNIDTTADIRADIADTRADIADTCADVAVSRDDVADNDADVTDIKADIAKTVADDADIRADIADTRADIADTSADMNGTVSLPANIQGDSDSLHIVWPHRWYVCLVCSTSETESFLKIIFTTEIKLCSDIQVVHLCRHIEFCDFHFITYFNY